MPHINVLCLSHTLFVYHILLTIITKTTQYKSRNYSHKKESHVACVKLCVHHHSGSIKHLSFIKLIMVNKKKRRDFTLELSQSNKENFASPAMSEERHTKIAIRTLSTSPCPSKRSDRRPSYYYCPGQSHPRCLRLVGCCQTQHALLPPC